MRIWLSLNISRWICNSPSLPSSSSSSLPIPFPFPLSPLPHWIPPLPLLVGIVVFEGCIVEAVGAGEGVGESRGGFQNSSTAVLDQVLCLRHCRITLLGLATLGGRLVIGLSAGLLVPIIGVSLGTVFSTIGLARASACLAASAGAAVITTGNVLTGAGIMGKVTSSSSLPLPYLNRTRSLLTFLQCSSLSFFRTVKHGIPINFMMSLISDHGEPTVTRKR
ncbi:hypothetical protein F5051DRAFT_229230 [Lentinula edodes]|nr:hypothetical protein F5051DRAFT_229230 [Lentinula edodes]